MPWEPKEAFRAMAGYHGAAARTEQPASSLERQGELREPWVDRLRKPASERRVIEIEGAEESGDGARPGPLADGGGLELQAELIPDVVRCADIVVQALEVVAGGVGVPGGRDPRSEPGQGQQDGQRCRGVLGNPGVEAQVGEQLLEPETRECWRPSWNTWATSWTATRSKNEPSGIRPSTSA